jgi:peptide subunit release factor 1 (eRF1)
MTVRYEYKCSNCGHNYVEQRGASESQFFIDCNKGDGGTYELVNEIKLADEIEVQVADPAPSE